ncbi:protein kinase [Luteolibacter yonseiensis]|uniref:Protein kinase n=1 Tax=Luteolibacter yonseiensis TaxID=1144680 RepID=A0A934V8I4_9BACT|nr:protein kinase [Luteolibacter yonseiensis]MBK1814148.1 protein kinase [Luteolibacter yonseiensis]
MDVPRVEGLKPKNLIGHGGCGRVYRAEDESAGECAVKIFERPSISPELLKRATERLETGGWPAGVMRVLAADLEEMPPFWVMPLLVDPVDGKPRSMQVSLDDHLGTRSWKLVRSIGRALAAMHERRVAHGNLKPGNVFFDERGEVLLSDWAIGNMPGAQEFHFTDAVLYQAPEQLRNKEGYLEDAGYRWDVFSFGVLAYRILTGRFPRCHDTFHFVAPPAGGTTKKGMQADLGKIAKNLEADDSVTWPDAAKNDVEKGFREWIERCLRLDVSRRPMTMLEVVAGFVAAENKAAPVVEPRKAEPPRRAAERTDGRPDGRVWGLLFLAGGAALVFAVLWRSSDAQLSKEREERRNDAALLKSSDDSAATARADAEKGRAEAETRRAEAEQALSYERELGIARLEASRLIGDQLFTWAMEKGNRSLPPLDGRELRLRRLERYFTDFLARTVDVRTLADERARVIIQLSEISLAAGDASTAGARLREALKAWDTMPMDAAMKLRMATNSLLLALLHGANGDPGAGASFVAARAALTAVPQAEVDADRLNQLLAVLDFHEAKLLAAKGDDAKALQQLLHATETLNRIADLRPDAAVLRSELANCYLSSATILEGMGKSGDAREVRMLASVELVKLLKNSPDDFALRLDLAGCYSAMAESAVLSGDIVGAESISKEAMKLLDRLVVEQPGNAEAVSRKASQLGLRAGIQRDKGFAAEAMKGYEEGIRMLEALRASSPDNGMAAYRLAQLWWQQGRMLGMSNKRGEEIVLIGQARELLEKLESTPAANGPRPEQLRSTAAYLSGDLGHALQLAGRKEEARATFSQAVTLWDNLLKSRPQSEEYSEGLAWCRQRLDDLK